MSALTIQGRSLTLMLDTYDDAANSSAGNAVPEEIEGRREASTISCSTSLAVRQASYPISLACPLLVAKLSHTASSMSLLS